jgi:NADH:ubiquinone oxidoreductase subunit 2 (subunit N)
MHQTMYIGFIISGIGTARYRSSSLARSIAFLNEGVLMSVHATLSDDRSEQTMHIVLAILCLTGATCAAADYKQKWALMTAGLTMTQSIWFEYIAFTRFSPTAPFSSSYLSKSMPTPHDVIVDACMLCLGMFVFVSQVHA